MRILLHGEVRLLLDDQIELSYTYSKEAVAGSRGNTNSPGGANNLSGAVGRRYVTIGAHAVMKDLVNGMKKKIEGVDSSSGPSGSFMPHLGLQAEAEREESALEQIILDDDVVKKSRTTSVLAETHCRVLTLDR